MTLQRPSSFPKITIASICHNTSIYLKFHYITFLQIPRMSLTFFKIIQRFLSFVIVTRFPQKYFRFSRYPISLCYRIITLLQVINSKLCLNLLHFLNSDFGDVTGSLPNLLRGQNFRRYSVSLSFVELH